MSAVDPNLQAAPSSNLEVQPSAKPLATAVELEPGAPSDVDLMLGFNRATPTRFLSFMIVTTGS
jgi:hypothetical protein